MRKKIALAVFGATLLSTTVIMAPSAQAANRNGVCESGEFCLYYNSDQGGSMVDMSGSVTDYGSASSTCVKFITAGAGQGLCVKNNAASYWNRESAVVTVFYKSDWAGAIDSIGSGAQANLNSTLKNENAGHVVGVSTNSTLEYGLYHSTGGRITAYFDGYLSTNGRHEGIDIANGIDAPVYALIGGRVTRVTEGAVGGSGLSTIAIYNAGLNRTIVYLHTNPSVGAGATISAGQRIATESWRGVSYSSSAHTHVEMRVGEQTSAAVSVGDPNLTNPIPTQFWMDRGYNICCD